MKTCKCCKKKLPENKFYLVHGKYCISDYLEIEDKYTDAVIGIAINKSLVELHKNCQAEKKGGSVKLMIENGYMTKSPVDLRGGGRHG